MRSSIGANGTHGGAAVQQFLEEGNLGRVLDRKGVSLDIHGAWLVGYSKAESRKKRRPSCLSGVQSLGRMEVLKVAVISQYSERMASSFRPMPPLLQSCLHGQQFSIPYVVQRSSTCGSIMHRGTFSEVYLDVEIRWCQFRQLRRQLQQ